MTTHITDWTDIFGNDITATRIMELFAHSGADLASWIEQESISLWGDDSPAADWSALARQVQRDAASEAERAA